jgi:hypothetical protein
MDTPYLGKGTYDAYVIEKSAIALQLLKDEKPAWIALARFHDEHMGKELEIVATYSLEDQQSGLFPEALEALRAWAKKRGAVSIRFSTLRAGMVKQAKQNGYEINEIMLRRDI